MLHLTWVDIQDIYTFFLSKQHPSVSKIGALCTIIVNISFSKSKKFKSQLDMIMINTDLVW